MLVNEAMRRQIVHLPAAAPIAKGINHLLKFKVNALLILDADQQPMGVVSKTDLIGAFYAGLSTDTFLGDIMSGAPLTCCPDDELESALEIMRSRRVHRLYVRGAVAAELVGTLSYTDVVALLYRYCRACPRSILRKEANLDAAEEGRLTVKEVMTSSVVSFPQKAGLDQVIEGLTAHRFGAVLVCGDGGEAKGVISKTDLVRAYLHDVSLDTEAGAVMSMPVAAFSQTAFLWEAIQHMFLKDVQRLFIHAGDPLRITGVLSLSDAAQARSGSCRACLPSRFMTPE
jgi:signal-transduction protein with cAMP-binding, CBS, and nucleotidyltransferase domain